MASTRGGDFATRSVAATRGGNVLVLFAMLFFAILALAALVIDLGLARLTQRQMQTAADSAALEGLRWRDQRPRFENTSEPLDELRRRDAKRMIAWHYDGDSTATDVNFGGRRGIVYSGGVGTPDVIAQPILDAAVLVYEPGDETVKKISTPDSDEEVNAELGLQFNTPQNEGSGDMVAGTYVNRLSDGASAEDIRDFHKEYVTIDREYVRFDFEYGDGDNAFLVRLRRTGEFPDIGPENHDGVASSGPPLPYIFAWGSYFPRVREDAFRNQFNPHILSDGIKIRATGVADARPAVVVGRDLWAREPFPEARVPGALPLAIHRDDWLSVPVFSMDADGDIDDDDDEPSNQQADVWIALDTPAHRLGELVDNTGDDPNNDTSISWSSYLSDRAAILDDEAIDGYVAIVDEVSSQAGPVLRVVGFGAIRFDSSELADIFRLQTASENSHGWIGPNASANLSMVWDAESTPQAAVALMTPTEVRALLQLNRELIEDHPLMAPVSVR